MDINSDFFFNVERGKPIGIEYNKHLLKRKGAVKK